MRESRAGSAAPGRARIVLAASLASLALFTALMLRGAEPFATWFYLFAWIPTLVAADAVVALVRGNFLLLSRPRFFASLAAWSAVIWLYYELVNLRLENWYYVNVPDDRAMRWGLTLIAFATVLPAVFLAEAVLDALGVARRLTWRPLRVTERFLRGLQVAGVLAFLPLLVLPRVFFPLVWGAAALIVEPAVYRRDASRSILGDLETGRPGRLLRLLMGGMAIGLTWEVFNIRARAKWIYTVPGFEDFKLFEMPVLGFFGFPPFAVECFVFWQALVLAGLAFPREKSERVPAPRWRVPVGYALAAIFCGVVLFSMEGRTWDSHRPRLEALHAVPAQPLQRAGYDAFSLARATPEEVAAAASATPGDAARWIEAARLATLRGIGAENAALLRSVGIEDVDALAAADAEHLTTQLEAASGRDIVPARIRVWVRAARNEAAREARAIPSPGASDRRSSP